VGLFLSTFTCDRCGQPARRVDRDDTPGRTLCASCSDELTAEAAAKHDTLLWYHRR
jgi:formylmethanofuran dehydrogenase subunit E